MRMPIICAGIGSAAALLGEAHAALVFALAVAHALDNWVAIAVENPSLSTLVKHLMECLFATLGIWMHRTSTLTLRYVCGFEQWNSHLGWLIGKNEDKPSLLGVREEGLKIRLAVQAIPKRTSPPRTESAAGSTRAREGRDPWLTVSGRTTLCLQVAAYGGGTLISAAMLLGCGLDLSSSMFFAMAVGTFARWFVSLSTLTANGAMGTILTVRAMATQFCRSLASTRTMFDRWDIARRLQLAMEASFAVVRDERALSRLEWHLATTRVLPRTQGPV